MYNFDISLSFLSTNLSKSVIFILEAKILTNLSLRQDISIGRLTISLIFSLIKLAASPNNLSILRKSADIKMDIQFFISSSGGLKFKGPAKSLFYAYYEVELFNI